MCGHDTQPICPYTGLARPCCGPVTVLGLRGCWGNTRTCGDTLVGRAVPLTWRFQGRSLEPGLREAVDTQGGQLRFAPSSGVPTGRCPHNRLSLHSTSRISDHLGMKACSRQRKDLGESLSPWV